MRRGGWWSKTWALRHRREGGCVFLTVGNHCRLHERFGAEVKPFACRLFPFLLIPASNQWRVGLRYSCPSAAANVGKLVTAYESDLKDLAQLLEKHVGRSADSAPCPALQAGQKVSWSDLMRIVEALKEIVQNRGARLEWRLRKCLALARICRQSRFENISGGRLDEFLRLVASGLDDEVPHDPNQVSAPGWLGRVLFRTLLAIFARKDRGNNQGPAARTPWSRVHAAWRFVRGKGPVPRLNNFLPETTFEIVNQSPSLPQITDETLERYYLSKMDSLQFCGPPNFDLSFWDGLDSLIFTFPVISWLARAFGNMDPVEAVQKAILLTDNHFGGNPLLGHRHNRFFMRTLAQRGELEKLVAWQSKNTSPFSG